MRLFKFVLFSLCTTFFSALAIAAEPASPGGNGPSLLPVAPLNLSAQPPKAPESPTAQKTMRLGHIDLARVNSESEVGKSGVKQLEDKKKKLQAQIEAKRKQLDKLKTSIEAKLQSMTPQQREAKGKEFQKKVEEFQKFGQGSENELQAMQQGLFASLYEKIERACADYGKANGLAVVVVKRELLYLDSGVETIDVTDGVIKLLNEKELKK
jgi:outer membrane protein